MELTHLDKIYWPKEKISKGELLKYYASIAKYILPYLKNRPLAMHRFPNGITGQSFFQKDMKTAPSFVKTYAVSHEKKDVHYILVQNAKTLLYVANLGSIELHLFHSTIKHLEKPDYLILDLDPEAIPFRAVVETALTIHEILKKVPHYCKTSGGRGLHIYIPLGGKYTYEQSRKLSWTIAQEVQKRLPKIISLERMPSKRQKKIYIDTLRNIKGQLAVSPYSVRALPGATVSTPLEWKEVNDDLDPKDFTIETVPARLAKKGDLFKGVLERPSKFTF